MPKVHDRGGWPSEGPIDTSEHPLLDWERRWDALGNVLSQKGLMRVDEVRRAIEGLPPEQYESLSYYERWVAARETLMVEKGILTREQIDRKVAKLEQGER